MTGKLKIEIVESVEILSRLIKQERNPQKKERIQQLMKEVYQKIEKPIQNREDVEMKQEEYQHQIKMFNTMQ